MPNRSQITPSTIAAPLARLPGWAYFAGLAAILIALTAAGALSWQHLTGRPLPGCGGVKQEQTGTSLTGAPDTAALPACATLEAHPMGSLGGMYSWLGAVSRGERLEKVMPDQARWPVSHLGAAYFAAALASWLAIGLSGRRPPGALRWVMRLGVVASLAYLAAIVLARKYCQYCITAHAGNLAWLAVTEIGMKFPSFDVRAPAAPRRWSFAPLSGAAVFAVVSAALGYAESGRRAELARAGDKALAESTGALLTKIAQDKAAAQNTPPKPKEEPPPWGTGGFTGRWLIGPKEAKVRLVMITDFQCPDCKRNDAEALALLEKHKDAISISTMHFPMCSDCNRRIVGDNPHPNACWAARAAETAGLIGGTGGFWKMHKWLFEKSGSFTDQEIREVIPKLGFGDSNAFLAVMQTDAPIRPITTDIEIAEALGLFFTPMIFINGVEFRGWPMPNGLTTAVEAALAADPPAQGPESDRPPLAREKFVADWREMGARVMPAPRPERVIGKPDSKAAVIIFGDYSEPNTPKVDTMVRGWAASGAKPIAYAFVHYPGDKSCNPSLPRTFFPFGCSAAKAAEAAGLIGGPETYWKLHDWLMSHRDRITSLGSIREGAASVGIDPEKLETAMADPKVVQAVQYDVEMAKQAGVGTIPAIFVNGKLVQRWSRENDNVLERIVDEAASGAKKP